MDKREAKPDPMHNHKCRPIAKAIAMADGRACWLGELLDPIPGYPAETHCLHITTPVKNVVFGINLGDMTTMAVFAQIVHGGPINQEWLARMEAVMKNMAGRSVTAEVAHA